jgi:DNA-binding GntR family transcriptional regulator
LGGLQVACFPGKEDAVAATIRGFGAAQLAELTELRLLIELPALRRLADRGLSDHELTLVRTLAEDTVRLARHRDVVGYLRADTAFHRCILELSGDPAVAEIAPFLLAPDQSRAPGLPMVHEAREHRELAVLLADGMVSAVDHLARVHLSRLSAGRKAAPAASARLQLVGCAGT